MKQLKGWWLNDTDTQFEHYIKDGGYQTVHRNTILNHIVMNKHTLKNCVDVGSHVGFWSKDFTELFNHTYAFDPMPIVRECYEKNITKSNYTLYPYGLGSVNQKIKVLYYPEETGNTHASNEGNYEIEVVNGAKNLIEKYKPFIHIEAKKKVMVKQNITMTSIEELFESINYKQVLAVKSELVYGPK